MKQDEKCFWLSLASLWATPVFIEIGSMAFAIASFSSFVLFGFASILNRYT